MESTVKVLVIIGVSMALALVLGIIGVGLFIMAGGNPLPRELADWSTLALGFIFGMVPGLLQKMLEAWLKRWETKV